MSGQAGPIFPLATVSAAVILAAVLARSHVLPPCAFLMQAARAEASALSSLSPAALATERQLVREASAVARTAAWGPPNVRDISAAGSPVQASCARAIRPAGVDTAPYPAVCTVAASGHALVILVPTFPRAFRMPASDAAQGAPVLR